MTRDDVKKIFAILVSAYTESRMPSMNEQTINAWHYLLSDIDGRIAQAAVARWITTERFPPTIADIRSSCIQVNAESADQAWGKVLEAVRKFGYTQKDEALMYLPENIRTIVSRFTWEYFCSMPIDEVSTYFAQFRNAYNAHIDHKRIELQAPEKINQILSGDVKQIEA